MLLQVTFLGAAIVTGGALEGADPCVDEGVSLESLANCKPFATHRAVVSPGSVGGSVQVRLEKQRMGICSDTDCFEIVQE